MLDFDWLGLAEKSLLLWVSWEMFKIWRLFSLHLHTSFPLCALIMLSAQRHEGQLSFALNQGCLSVFQSILKIAMTFVLFDEGQGPTIHGSFISPSWHSHVSLFSHCHPQPTFGSVFVPVSSLPLVTITPFYPNHTLFLLWYHILYDLSMSYLHLILIYLNPS